MSHEHRQRGVRPAGHFDRGHLHENSEGGVAPNVASQSSDLNEHQRHKHRVLCGSRNSMSETGRTELAPSLFGAPNSASAWKNGSGGTAFSSTPELCEADAGQAWRDPLQTSGFYTYPMEALALLTRAHINAYKFNRRHRLERRIRSSWHRTHAAFNSRAGTMARTAARPPCSIQHVLVGEVGPTHSYRSSVFFPSRTNAQSRGPAPTARKVRLRTASFASRAPPPPTTRVLPSRNPFPK